MSTKRRRLKRAAQEEIGLQIAPMIDVTLLLLFFFMLSGRLTKSNKIKTIGVPFASAAQPAENTDESHVINVDGTGRWFAGDTPVSTTELAAQLRTRFQNTPPTKLHVRADAQTPAAKIKELMNLAADAGAIEVVYGVRKP